MGSSINYRGMKDSRMMLSLIGMLWDKFQTSHHCHLSTFLTNRSPLWHMLIKQGEYTSSFTDLLIANLSSKALLTDNSYMMCKCLIFGLSSSAKGALVFPCYFELISLSSSASFLQLILSSCFTVLKHLCTSPLKHWELVLSWLRLSKTLLN